MLMVYYRLSQGFSESDTAGLPSDTTWNQAPPSPFAFLTYFAQFLDVYEIIIMLFDLADIQQLSQGSIILLFHIRSVQRHLLDPDSGKSGKNRKIVHYCIS